MKDYVGYGDTTVSISGKISREKTKTWGFNDDNKLVLKDTEVCRYVCLPCRLVVVAATMGQAENIALKHESSNKHVIAMAEKVKA